MSDIVRNPKPARRISGLGRGFLMLALPLLAAQDSAGAYFVYVSVEASNAIEVYAMDPETGALEKKTAVAVPGGPAPLALSPDRKVLYVSQRPAKTLSAFAVNRATGALALLNTVTAPENAVYIATDRTGKYLLSAYYGGARMAIHPIAGDGKLAAEPVENRVTGTNPHFIMTDPSNRYLYVPNTGAGKILQFGFDAATGKVQPLSPPEVVSAPGAGPRHFIFHGSKDIVYVVNEKNRSLTAYAMNPAQGTLSPLQTVPTVPSAYTGENACADIHLTPDNRFLYASNRGHQSLAGYKVDPVTGQLTSIGWTKTPQTPRSFAIDPTGKFLYAGGQSADSLASYRIDQATGALAPMKVYPTGESPAWVIAVLLQEGPVSLDRAAAREDGREGMPFGPGLQGGRFYDLLGRSWREGAASRRITGSTPPIRVGVEKD